MHITEKHSLKRPSIPPELCRPSIIGSTLLIVYAIALYAVPAFLARAVLFTSLPLPLVILLMIPLIWLAGQGLLLMAWVGHEGAAHFLLYPNKFFSALVGLFVSSALPSFLELGFAVSHRNHHRFTNQTSDPDCRVFSPFKNFWAKLFMARTAADIQYFKDAIKMAFNLPLPYPYPFPLKSRSIIILAWANISFSLLWLALYTFITLNDPITGIVSIARPFLVTYLLSSLQPYLEHAGTEEGLGRDARSRVSPLFTVLYCGNNYHLEHHLYPGAPCYRLPMIHRLLKEQGFYERAGSFVVPTILDPYAQAASFPYPQPICEDSNYDPLLPLHNQ